MQGGDEVVVLLPSLVVNGEAVLQAFPGSFLIDPPPHSDQCRRRAERSSRISVGRFREQP